MPTRKDTAAGTSDLRSEVSQVTLAQRELRAPRIRQIESRVEFYCNDHLSFTAAVTHAEIFA
jgi:hypothetical protein